MPLRGAVVPVVSRRERSTYLSPGVKTESFLVQQAAF